MVLGPQPVQARITSFRGFWPEQQLAAGRRPVIHDRRSPCPAFSTRPSAPNTSCHLANPAARARPLGANFERHSGWQA